MAIVFNQRVLHERVEFLPGPVVAFEDPDAAPYFIAMGWAEEADAEPVRTYSQDEVSVDPDTVFADGSSKGRKVMEVANG